MGFLTLIEPSVGGPSVSTWVAGGTFTTDSDGTTAVESPTGDWSVISNQAVDISDGSYTLSGSHLTYNPEIQARFTDPNNAGMGYMEVSALSMSGPDQYPSVEFAMPGNQILFSTDTSGNIVMYNADGSWIDLPPLPFYVGYGYSPGLGGWVSGIWANAPSGEVISGLPTDDRIISGDNYDSATGVYLQSYAMSPFDYRSDYTQGGDGGVPYNVTVSAGSVYIGTTEYWLSASVTVGPLMQTLCVFNAQTQVALDAAYPFPVASAKAIASPALRGARRLG